MNKKTFLGCKVARQANCLCIELIKSLILLATSLVKSGCNAVARCYNVKRVARGFTVLRI